MVLVQNRYKNTLVGVLRTKITFVTHPSPSCYVTLRTQVIRLNSGNLGPQKTDSGVFIIVSMSPSHEQVSEYISDSYDVIIHMVLILWGHEFQITITYVNE